MHRAPLHRGFATCTALVWALATATSAVASPTAVNVVSRGHTRLSSAAWSRAVTRICAPALLFEGRHEIGTQAGAIAVAHDIGSSTRKRLERIERLVAPEAESGHIRAWLGLEQRLAEAYAASYLRIYDVIAVTHTPRQRAREPRLLGRILHAPDRLSKAAARAEQQLQIPDCTGGTVPSPSPTISASAKTHA